MKAAGRSTPLTKPQVTPIVPTTNVLGEEREFLFTEQDFGRIRKLIYERAGISLSPVKRGRVSIH